MGVARSLIVLQCLMRLIDDWLLITTSLVKANRFYDMVSKGMYACYIPPLPSLRLAVL